MTQQEREAIVMAKKWQANSAQGIKPAAGSDGSIALLVRNNRASSVLYCRCVILNYNR
ncbi:MAG: hypothetical protein H6937_09800 [Burkholderiales bacterium]|nr:hypothetical protein [Burkholderiales bacterium]